MQRRLQLSDPLRRVTDSPGLYPPACTQLPLGQDTARAAAGESVPLLPPLVEHVTVRHARPLPVQGACQQVNKLILTFAFAFPFVGCLCMQCPFLHLQAVTTLILHSTMQNDSFFFKV